MEFVYSVKARRIGQKECRRLGFVTAISAEAATAKAKVALDHPGRLDKRLPGTGSVAEVRVRQLGPDFTTASKFKEPRF